MKKGSWEVLRQPPRRRVLQEIPRNSSYTWGSFIKEMQILYSHCYTWLPAFPFVSSFPAHWESLWLNYQFSISPCSLIFTYRLTEPGSQHENLNKVVQWRKNGNHLRIKNPNEILQCNCLTTPTHPPPRAEKRKRKTPPFVKLHVSC